MKAISKAWIVLILVILSLFTTAVSIIFLRANHIKDGASLTVTNAEIVTLANGFKFTEGPAADSRGNVYFSDIPNNRIYKWSQKNVLSVFFENSKGVNGLFIDKKGELIACQGGSGKLISIDQKGLVTVLAESFNGKSFNSPNDLWIRPDGGIYFTDPRYGTRDNLPQEGEHVYYLSPDRKRLIRVIDDMVRPNGLIGTPDGKKLYVADHGGNQTFVYSINQDGSLSNKKLFVSYGSDGMTMDQLGNVYLTTNAVLIFDQDGIIIETIDLPQRPANLTFGGTDNKTLFITARTGFYSIEMNVKGQ